MTPSISELHKVLNTRELRRIRVRIKEEAQELKRLVSDGLEEDLVEDEDTPLDLDLEEP